MDVKMGWQQKGMSEIASFHYTLPIYWDSLSCLNTFSPFASWFLLYTFMHAYFHILMFLYTRWSHQSHEFVYFIRLRCPWALPVLCVYSSTKVESLPSSKGTICTAVILWNQLISKTSVSGCKYMDTKQKPITHALQIFVHICITSWQRRINSHLQVNYRLQSFLTW